MKEREVIEALLESTKRLSGQINAPFSSDSEIVTVGDTRLALSVDDYSEEDALSAGDPALLGWNLVTATLSDILAVGADPVFLLHSVIVNESISEDWLRGFGSGIQGALASFGASLVGGDVGRGGDWRYTGIGVGTFDKEIQPVSRVLRDREGTLAITGSLGDANAGALLSLGGVRFECRYDEVIKARDKASACIDTSDGFVNALALLAEVNPEIAFNIDTDKLPFDKKVLSAAEEKGIKKECFLFGSAGEYELLVAAPVAEDELKACGFTPVGCYSAGKTPGLFFEKINSTVRIPVENLPDPRTFEKREEYIFSIITMVEKLLR